MSDILMYKSLNDSVLDVDTTSRRVKNALNRVGVKDSDSDIIDKAAFKKTVQERGPKGKNLIWHLTDHVPSLKSAIGKFSELYMEGDYLVGVTDIPNTSWGNDMMEFYKTGAINQHSVGFSTEKKEVINDNSPADRYTIIKEVKLYEGSSVLWGANEDTPNLSVGKDLSFEEKIELHKDLIKQIGDLTKLFRDGRLMDQSFELVEYKIKQLQNLADGLFTTAVITEPAEKAVQPEQMKPVNSADLRFIRTMMPHHMEAIQMAESYLKDGVNPKIRRLAERIIRNQTEEIQTMQKFMQEEASKSIEMELTERLLLMTLKLM